MILKVVSKGSYGSNLIHVDVGSADRWSAGVWLGMTCTSLSKSLTVLYFPTSLAPAFLIKLDTHPAALMLS
eukprot:153930-Pelagomonas_calceolata.AAC.1